MPRIVILGGGFAGLCTAQRLLDKNNKIFIIDNYWLDNDKRRGVPQANHLHVLLLEGQRLLEKLFPGILEELIAAGANYIDWAKDTYWQSPYGLYPRYPSAIKTLLFSRQLLDKLIYRRITHSSSSPFLLIKGKIKKLIFDQKTIRAVEYQSEKKTYQLKADLFIECRGRGSNLSTLLAEHSLLTKKKVVSNTVEYFSIQLPKTEITLPNCKQFYLQADKKICPIGCVISPIENDDYMLTFIATYKDAFKHVKTINDLLTLIKHPSLLNIFKPNLAISKFSNFKKLINEKKYFSQLKLTNFLVLGDALCYLNPVYGQGMTIALKQIFAIDKRLKKPCVIQQKKIERKNRLGWLLATSEDLRWQKRKSSAVYFINKSLSLWLRAATKSMFMHYLFLKLLHMYISFWTVRFIWNRE